MVVVAAIVGDPEGASARVMRAVSTGEVRLALSDDYLSELVRVIGYPEVEEKIEHPVRAFEVALDITGMGSMYHPRRHDWPSVRDSGDWWVLDLAYESGADFIVTLDTGLFRDAPGLGFNVALPADFLYQLRAR
jgi:putative PIN family toxin of toxin-antitoxin system